MSGLLRRGHMVTHGQLSIFLRLKGITFRNLAFGFAVLLFVWTSRYTFFSRPSFALPEHIHAHPTTQEEWQHRADQVKAAFVHAYHGYEQNAWMWDELKPLSGSGQNKYAFLQYKFQYVVMKHPVSMDGA
jgi:hypothetical protein